MDFLHQTGKPLLSLTSADPQYPAAFEAFLGQTAPAAVAALGDLALLDRRPLALFCSQTAPAAVILAVHDLAQQWRHGERVIIGGFHSPAEEEALIVLLRGPAPVIICPARSLAGMRLKREVAGSLDESRLLLLSACADKVRRPTVATAAYRNRIVAALADAVFVAHAEPGGKTEALAREVIGWGKPVYTVAHPANANLFTLGARDASAFLHREPTDYVEISRRLYAEQTINDIFERARKQWQG